MLHTDSSSFRGQYPSCRGEGGDEWLNYEPGGAQNGLLVLGNEVAANHEEKQVTEFPNAPPIYGNPIPIWPNSKFII